MSTFELHIVDGKAGLAHHAQPPEAAQCLSFGCSSRSQPQSTTSKPRQNGCILLAGGEQAFAPGRRQLSKWASPKTSSTCFSSYFRRIGATVAELPQADDRRRQAAMRSASCCEHRMRFDIIIAAPPTPRPFVQPEITLAPVPCIGGRAATACDANPRRLIWCLTVRIMNAARGGLLGW